MAPIMHWVIVYWDTRVSYMVTMLVFWIIMIMILGSPFLQHTVIYLKQLIIKLISRVILYRPITIIPVYKFIRIVVLNCIYFIFFNRRITICTIEAQ